jgi:NTE family protein
MLSRVAETMSKLDDKSAQGEYYRNEGGHDLSVSSGHIIASPQAVELELRPSEKTSKPVQSFNVRIPSRILSLCGGGHLCIVHIGILKALRDRSLLTYIKGVVGISAGALIALIYILGYTLHEMELLLQTIDLSMFTSIESDSALLFYQTLCVNSGEMLDLFIINLLEKKGYSSTTTFAELHRKKSLFFRCYATRLQTSDIQEFSLEKTPNHTILFALRATMCLPIIFAPLKDPFTDILYYDAALIHNMPFVFLKEEEKQNSICVFFDLLTDTTKQEYDFTDIFKYACKSLYGTRNNYFLNKYGEFILKVSVDFTKLLDCNTREAKDELIERGYTNCIRFLDCKPTNTLARRYSVS